MNKRAIALLMVFASSPAFAQQGETPAESDVAYPEVTEIEFVGQAVTGTVVGPNGDIYIAPPRAEFKPMIRLRADFNEEMAQSVNRVR